MKRLVLLVVVATLAVAALPAPRAEAQVVSAHTINVSKAVANWYWIPRGHTVCSPVHINNWYAVNPAMTMDWIMATFRGPHPNGSVYCTVIYNHEVTWTRRTFCYAMVHEYGHLAGIGHSTVPGTVMYPYGTVPIADCNQAFPSG